MTTTRTEKNNISQHEGTDRTTVAWRMPLSTSHDRSNSINSIPTVTSSPLIHEDKCVRIDIIFVSPYGTTDFINALNVE